MKAAVQITRRKRCLALTSVGFTFAFGLSVTQRGNQVWACLTRGHTLRAGRAKISEQSPVELKSWLARKVADVVVSDERWVKNRRFVDNGGALLGGDQASAHVVNNGPGNDLLEIDIDGNGVSDMNVSLQNMTGTLHNGSFLLS